MTRSNDAQADGELRVDGQVLRYVAGEESFDLSIADIALLGEYTTTGGPAACDYFLVFVTSSGARYDASFYAAGRDTALAGLSSSWQSPVTLQLAASTSLSSNIVWPSSQAGQPLFEFQERPASGMISRLRAKLGVAALEEHWSPAALETFLDEAHRELDGDPGRALVTTRFVLEKVERRHSAATTASRRVHGRAWKEYGTALYMAGRFAEAVDASVQARAMFEEDPELVSDRATALLLTALVQNALHDHQAALALLDECTAVFEVCRDSSRILKALELRAIVLFDLHRYDEAVETLQRALAQVESIGDERELARIENNIGRCALQAKNYSEAMHYVQRAAFRFNKFGMDAECTRAWWGIARIHKALGRKSEALAQLVRVEDGFRKLGMSGMADKVSEEKEELAGAA